ncbi:hypothetical protein BS47DRAFT_1486230 [Hydnum rufescens UP504]|uniref:Uncharacterized protein n=1 Tax=Hydnum rufescens UP504 TaxID=1448309 RepID=A0A9P6DVD2_9AGAM|nr:hypothetical protein BS47DRAFT_1486230 [Hydnum rufescens UP504]
MARLNRPALYSALAKAALVTGLSFTQSRYIPRIPRVFKWVVVFFYVLNIRAAPLSWHFRILYPWFSARWGNQLAGKTGGLRGKLAHLHKHSLLNQNPLDYIEVWRYKAHISDCDYNLHLSNSAYAKNLDFVRMNAAVRLFPGFHGAGGTLALAGAHFYWIKEIPMFADYEVRLHFGGWEESKWVYLFGQYVTYPKSKRGSKPAKAIEKASENAAPTAEDAAKNLLRGIKPNSLGVSSNSLVIGDSMVIVPEGSTDSSALPSGLATPALPGTVSPGPSHPLLSMFLPPEGATVHAVAISQYCFKFGRITVPPRVALIASGFGAAGLIPNLPPSAPGHGKTRWDRLQDVRAGKEGKGKLKNY